MVLHPNGEGEVYPIYCRKKGTLEAAEEVILDQNELARDKKFHALGGFDVSPDGSRLLYLEDVTAFREYTLSVKDLRTGRVIDSIEKVWNGTAWANDNRTLFYVTADDAKRGNAVWRHVIEAPREQDTKVFQEDNVLNEVTAFRSRSGKYVFICADGFTSSEWRVVPTANPMAAPRVIAPRRGNVEYSVNMVVNSSTSILTTRRATFESCARQRTIHRLPNGKIGWHTARRRSSKASTFLSDMLSSANEPRDFAGCA